MTKKNRLFTFLSYVSIGLILLLLFILILIGIIPSFERPSTSDQSDIIQGVEYRVLRIMGSENSISHIDVYIKSLDDVLDNDLVNFIKIFYIDTKEIVLREDYYKNLIENINHEKKLFNIQNSSEQCIFCLHHENLLRVDLKSGTCDKWITSYALNDSLFITYSFKPEKDTIIVL